MKPIDERAVKLHTVGNTCLADQKFNDAIAHYVKALEISPFYPAAHYHLAEAYEAKKLAAQAEEEYRTAIEQNPDFAETHIMSGLDSLLSGPLAKAVAAYKLQKKGAAQQPPHDEQPEAPVQKTAPTPRQATSAPAQAAAYKNLKAAKIKILPADELNSIAGSTSPIFVTVLSDKNLPIPGMPVEFSIVTPGGQSDDSILLDTSHFPPIESKTATVITDAKANASIDFRRSSKSGANILKVVVAGVAPTQITDNTVADQIHSVKIEPEPNECVAGTVFEFILTPIDRHGNPVPSIELEISLSELDDGKWDATDNRIVKIDDTAKSLCRFTMPSRSGAKCRFNVIFKPTSFSREFEVKTIPGPPHSVMFTPTGGTVAAGEPFEVRARVLDEFDNSVGGEPASIELKSGSGGDWQIGRQSGDVTNRDGIVFIVATPPNAIGAVGEFTVRAATISSENAAVAEFRTVEADKAEILSVAGHTNVEAASNERVVPGFDDFEYDSVDIATAGAPLPEPTDKPSVVLPIPEPVGPPAEGLSGLDSMDFDLGSDAFGPKGGTDFAPPASMPSTSYAPPEAPVSSLDALGAMLDIDGPGPMSTPSPTPQFTEPAAAISSDSISMQHAVDDIDATDRHDELATHSDDIRHSPWAHLEDDFEQSVARTEIVPDTPPPSSKTDSFETPSFPEPQEAQFSAPASYDSTTQSDFTIFVPEHTLQCHVGEMLTFVVSLIDANGLPLENRDLHLRIGTTSHGESGAHFIVPAGAEPDAAEGTTDSEGELPVTVESISPGAFTITVETSGKTSEIHIEAESAASVAYEEINAPTEPQFDADVPSLSKPHEQPAATQPVAYHEPSTQSPQEPSAEHTAPEAPTQETAFYAPAEHTEPTFDTQRTADMSQMPEIPSIPAPPPPPPPPPEIEYVPDETPIPEANYGASAYAQQAPAQAAESEIEEYIPEEDADPMSMPRFRVRRGRKPVMEIGKVMPKVYILIASAVVVALLGLAAMKAYQYVNFQYSYYNGMNAFNSNSLDVALTHFEKCAELHPKDPEPYRYIFQMHYRYAEIFEKQNNQLRKKKELVMALDAADKLLTIVPTDTDAMFNKAQAQEFMGMYCPAIRTYENLQRIDPSYTGAGLKIKIIQEAHKITCK